MPELVPIAGRPDLRPIFEASEELESSTREMIAAAPYCGLGFRRARLPGDLHARMLESLRNNAPRFRAEPEDNPWMGSVNRRTIPALFFQDDDLNRAVSRELHAGHEEWAGQKLHESACYGIRVYQRGTYLYNHVDHTNTHIISATICVDHRLDEPWPLYIEDIDGNVHLVDMEPGEFLHYEGAKLKHGRPYPLVGDYYAGMFVHYRPVELPSSEHR